MPLIPYNAFARNELTNRANWFSRVWTLMSTAIITIWGDNAWHTPTFQNSWVNYNTATIAACQYRVRDGILHIKGAIKSGTVATTVFQLPAGFYPAGQTFWVAMSLTSSARVDLTNGALSVIAYNSGANNTQVILDITVPID